MKKLLGISLVAVLAVSPLMAGAAGTDPTAATTTSEPYKGLAITDADKAAAASAAYVKGAYNAAIGAVDAIKADAANKDLSNLTTTGYENVSAKGTYDAAKTYDAGTVGAAIKSKANTADLATVATSGKSSDLNNDAGFITKDVSNLTNYTKTTDLATVATSGKASDLTTDATHQLVSDTEKSTWSGKQDALNPTQMAAVNSGINSTKVGQYDTLVTNSANFATKEGVSASINKAKAKGNISTTISNGSVGGTLTSNTSGLKIGGGTISNTVTPATTNVPTTYSSNMMVNWGDTTPGSLATASGTRAVMTGVDVDSRLANATVTSGSITHTLTGLTVSGNVQQNNVEFDVKSAGYVDNASDTIPEYAPANS